MDFEDLRLCDLLDKINARTVEIAKTRNVSDFSALGKNIQAAYDFFVAASKPYEAQQGMLKNMFSSFNYAAVIINDSIKKKALDKQASEMLGECLEIISACCANIKKSLESGE